jgi:hypothetical protein
MVSNSTNINKTQTKKRKFKFKDDFNFTNRNAWLKLPCNRDHGEPAITKTLIQSVTVKHFFTVYYLVVWPLNIPQAG